MRRETTVERVGGYRVIRKLATGGTSDVLLAKAEGPHGFERTVVLKLLLEQRSTDDELAQMFAREAHAYARLSHSAIVRLFDFLSIPVEAGAANGGGQLCMVLEYIDGPPLSRLRSMLKAVGLELDDRAAIYIASRIFDALAAAHTATDDSGSFAPVIHRDVNPSNVLVPWDGQVKLADFGVAKVTGSTHQSTAGMIKGTYGYMAPEQVTGDPVTPRADVYAAGIILWELLARRRAFHRGALPEVEALRAMAEPRIVSLDTLRPEVDRGVRDALTRALEPRAERRTITAEEMVAILRASVSLEEGREQLVSALAAVRNDPQAAMAAASIPPSPSASMTPRPMGTLVVGKTPGMDAMLSRPAAGSRPDLPPVPPSSGKLPRPAPPPVVPPPPSPRRVRTVSTVDPVEASSVTMTIASSVDEADGPEERAETLVSAGIAKPSSDDAITKPPPGDGTFHDPTFSLGAPESASTKLRDAIDDALRGHASSVPPPLLPSDVPGVMNVVVPPPAPTPERRLPQLGEPVVEETDTRILPPRASKAEDASFAAAVRELEAAEALTVAPPPEEPTSRMPTAKPVATQPMPWAGEPAPRGTVPPPAVARPTKRSAAPVVAVLLLLGAAAMGASVYLQYRNARPLVAPAASVPKPPVAAAVAPVVASASAAPEAPSAVPSVSAAPSATDAPAASASATPPSTPEPAAAPAEPSGEIEEGMGLVKTTGAISGRRIFVDDRVLGQTPESVTVKCGPHTVRLGSSGKPQKIDVPCRGEVTIVDKKE